MLTELQINEAISGWFEPMPTADDTRAILNRNWSQSPKGLWTVARSSGADPNNFESFYWRPTDFYHDEAANARLLEAMRKPLLVSDWPGCEGWRVDMGVEYFEGPLIGPTHADRKTAVVLAFCQFAKIEVTHVD